MIWPIEGILNMTTQPKIELRGIKYTAWASEETHCYQATLYVDGVKLGTVSNDGHGGCDNFYPVSGKRDDCIAALNKRIADTFAPYKYEGGEIEQNLEMVCADLVNRWLTEKDFDRAMKSKVLFTDPERAGVFLYAVKKPHTHASMLAAVKAKFPQYTYLSDLPRDQALALYQA